MSSQDFLLSAALSIPLLCDSSRACGARILAAAQVSRRATGCNTNLGMLLLLAPLVCAAERAPRLQASTLREALGAVLRSLNAEDTQHIFSAIRFMAPGGLGRVPRHDVSRPADCGILEAMRAASERDSIARQYVTGFEDIFRGGLQATRHYLRRGLGWQWATVGTYLHFLSALEDSHIRRKHGRHQARQVRRLGRALAACFRQAPKRTATRRRLWLRGQRWVLAGLNPGTSADLTAASVFVCLLTQAHRRARSGARFHGYQKTP